MQAEEEEGQASESSLQDVQDSEQGSSDEEEDDVGVPTVAKPVAKLSGSCRPEHTVRTRDCSALPCPALPCPALPCPNLSTNPNQNPLLIDGASVSAVHTTDPHDGFSNLTW